MQWEYHQQTFGHETTIIVKWILYIGAKNRCGYLVLVIGLIAKLLNCCLKKHQGGSIFRGAPSWMSLSDLFCDLFPLMFRAMNQVLDVWWILPLKSTQPTIYYIAGGSAVSSTFSTFHAAWNGQKVETSNLCSSKQLLRLDPFGLFLGSAHTHTHLRGYLERTWTSQNLEIFHFKPIPVPIPQPDPVFNVMFRMLQARNIEQPPKTKEHHPKSSLTSVRHQPNPSKSQMFFCDCHIYRITAWPVPVGTSCVPVAAGVPLGIGGFTMERWGFWPPMNHRKT